MGTHNHQHQHFHNASGTALVLQALSGMENRIMSKLDEVEKEIDQESALVNQVLAQKVTDAAASAATIADLKAQLAAALAAAGPVDAQAQGMLDKLTAEITTLQGVLTPVAPPAGSEAPPAAGGAA